MIVNKYQGNGGGGGSIQPATPNRLGGVKIGSGVAVTSDGTISVSGGSIDSGAVQTQIDNSINSLITNLEDDGYVANAGYADEAEMAYQLYSEDGVVSDGLYSYRTTAGDEDVDTGEAFLRRLEGNATYPEKTYDDEGFLFRSGEEVEGFEMEFEWGQGWLPEAEVDKSEERPQAVRLSTPRFDEQNMDYTHYSFNGNSNVYVFLRVYKSGTVNVMDSSHCTATTQNNYLFSAEGLTGTINVDFEEEYITLTITGGTGYISTAYTYNYNDYTQYYVAIPNDIPLGNSNYIYDASSTAWTPSLPQAISYMGLNGEEYVPEDGDEISIKSYVYADSEAIYPRPKSFLSYGLNSFSRNNILTQLKKSMKVYYDANEPDGNYSIENNVSEYTFTVMAVPGLADGYIVHSPGGNLPYRAGVASMGDVTDPDIAIDYSNTLMLDDSKTFVVYPTSEMPYVIFSILPENENDICVHPRWSGKKDTAFEEWNETSIQLIDAIDAASNAEGFELVSIGDVRNVFDIEHQSVKMNIGIMDFGPDDLIDLFDEGKVLGEDIEVDGDYIYYVLDEPYEVSFEDLGIDMDGQYEANDFGVEIFSVEDDNNDIVMPTPVYAETFYATNLVDKLRRMKTDFVHLDSIDTIGEEGITYEYDGVLMTWNPNSGYAGEWLKMPSEGQGTGLIFSHIPNGQKLFDFKYRYGGDARNVYMSGGILYCAETGGTVVSAITIGNKFELTSTQNNRKVYGVYEKNYIGIRTGDYCDLSNIWSGNVNGGHYELIDKTNYPYLGSTNDIYAGIPEFNGRGQIVRHVGNVDTKAIQFNTDASQYGSTGKINFYTTGTNNGPSRIFAPTQGGTEGQVLTSAGAGSEPQWATMIKAIRITYDEYEALATKDPNTLYLIVDE